MEWDYTMSEQYHLRCARGDVGRYVLMPGDPGRCEVIAAHLDDAHLVARNREFTTYTGYLDGEKVSVTSTGVGSPSTAIAVEELLAIGADTFIRVGTAGGLQRHLLVGSVVVASAAVRNDGTSLQYVPLSYPAVADPDVLRALVLAAQQHAPSSHTGIIISTDALYADLAPQTLPLSALNSGRWDQVWAQANVLAAEMECATLFVVSTIRRARAGCIVTVVNSTGEGDIDTAVTTLSLEPMISSACSAIRRLIAQDKQTA